MSTHPDTHTHHIYKKEDEDQLPFIWWVEAYLIKQPNETQDLNRAASRWFFEYWIWWVMSDDRSQSLSKSTKIQS